MDRNYKVKTRNSTVEYTVRKLEPGGKYHIVVQLGNMSKEASLKISTGGPRLIRKPLLGEPSGAEFVGLIPFPALGWNLVPTHPGGKVPLDSAGLTSE